MSLQPLKQYPQAIDETPEGTAEALQKIGQIRQNDQTQWLDLKNQFLTGRSVAKIPTSSASASGDRVGDFNVTPTYAYFCVNNAGSAEWVRIAVSTF